MTLRCIENTSPIVKAIDVIEDFCTPEVPVLQRNVSLDEITFADIAVIFDVHYITYYITYIEFSVVLRVVLVHMKYEVVIVHMKYDFQSFQSHLSQNRVQFRHHLCKTILHV